MTATDVVIGGGGIIGLSAALELARNGFRVTVLERGLAMAEASWAAAGMLAAEDPENPPQLAALAALSRDLYGEYLGAVERGSGRSVPLRTRGTLQATEPGGSFACRETPTRFSIGAEEAERRIQGLAVQGLAVGGRAPGRRSFLWIEEQSLDPRELCAALPAAAAAAGVNLQEETEVLAVDAQPGGVKVTTPGGTVSAGAFVNCCGAWAAALRPSAQGAELRSAGASVEPRKGQMATVRLRPPARLDSVLRTPRIYLVPRGDGRVVIGATVERAGFDRQVDEGAVQHLLALAAELWPPVAGSPVVESWAGLRPATEDGLPLIGSAGVPNCWLATGHFRNGILLAPATAVLLRQLIEGKPLSVALDAFRPERESACG